MKGKDDPTAFLPLSQKLGGNSKKAEVNRYDSIGKSCLTSKLTKYIYKKVELGSLINKNTMKEEIDSDIKLDRIDNNSGDENPYRELIVNNAGKVESTLSQMEQWSTFSNVTNYVWYSKNPKNFYAMLMKPINKNTINVGRREEDKTNFHHKYILQTLQIG